MECIVQNEGGVACQYRFLRVRVIFPSGLNAQVVSSDGRPLSNIELTDTVLIYPGERYGVIAEGNGDFHVQDSIVKKLIKE